MRKCVYKHTLGIAFLFTLTFGFAQKKYQAQATSAQLSLEGKSLSGYTTSFDFGWEKVRKGWWSYAREFGAPLNMKTYYKVTIPSSTTDGNVDLEVFTQTTDGNGGTEFFLGLENKKYERQALAMILDFKKKFYIDDLVEQMEMKQEKSEALGDEYRDAVIDTKKQELLKRINQLETEVEAIKQQIRLIEKS